MFSVNPATNNESEIMIEAAFGLGEVVVGGGYRVTPALVNVFSESSEFSEGAFGWLVNAYYETGTTPGSVTAIAYCATITP